MFRHIGTVLLLSAIALSILAPGMKVDASLIIEWAIPTGDSQPREIYLDGNLTYFTEYSGNKIGCLDVSSGLFKEWTIPTVSSGPHGIYVSGGLVYFTEYLGNKIGCLNPSTGVFNEWTVPTANSQPREICVSGGLVYFTEYNGNKIGRLNPFSGEFTEWGTRLKPWSITSSGGIIFFTAHEGSVGRLDPATNIITYWGEAYYPTEVCVSGNLVYYVGTWYPGSFSPPPQSAYRINALDPATNLRTLWELPSYALIFDISVSSGMIYYVDNGRNMIGRLDQATSIFNEWTVPTGDSHPYSIWVSGSKIYFSENTGNKIGCLTISPRTSVTVIGYTFHPTESKYTTSTTASSPLLSTNTTTALINTTTSGTVTRTASTYSLWDTLVIAIIPTATNTTTRTITTTTTSISPTTTSTTSTTSTTTTLSTATVTSVSVTWQDHVRVDTITTIITVAGFERVTSTIVQLVTVTVTAGSTVTSLSATTALATSQTTTSTTSTTTTTETTTVTTTETYRPAIFSRCIIATAAYGSELAPEVQFLRVFRDQYVQSTFAGDSFMKAFNGFYYSFSPIVASAVAESATLSQIVRILLYPLVTTLHASSAIFHSLSFMPELAVVISGIFASVLVGAAYLIPLILLVETCKRHTKKMNQR